MGASPLDVFRQDRVRLPAAESKQDCGHPGLTKLLAGSGVPPGGPRVEVHCHFVNFTPDNRFLIATDTGLNKVFIHRIDAANGTFIARDPPFLGLQHQASPRQFRFHSNGKWAYIANESGPGCTMLGYDTRRGVFEEGPTGRTVPESYREWMTCAEVEVHPSGEFVYVSNRGHNSIPAMSIDQSTGAPSLIEAFPLGGNNPRSFNIDPTGGYLFAMLQRSDVIVPLRIDRRSADYRDLARTFHCLRLCARSLVEIS